MKTRARIPGEVVATYDAETGTTKLVFTPFGSSAGYFGPTAMVIEGDDTLDVESTDGPFWRSIQKLLSENGEAISWQE